MKKSKQLSIAGSIANPHRFLAIYARTLLPRFVGRKLRPENAPETPIFARLTSPKRPQMRAPHRLSQPGAIFRARRRTTFRAKTR